MISYAVLSESVHWVCVVNDGQIRKIAQTNADLRLAERIRDLLDRHGLVDVPLEEIEPAET